MDTLEGTTKDVIKANIEKMKQLFPEVFTENKIMWDRLQQMLGDYIETEKERYEFRWKGKSEAIQLAQMQSTGTLRPCKEESIEWEKTKNLYIEGENLEVLRILQNSYWNKVKLIYIDPPYNTGKDFIYYDNYSENIKAYKERMNEQLKSNVETNGRYHTDWLNMMYSRIKIAKNLLSDDGSIFISIDDNELANTIKMCDEIFGEENFFAQVVVQSNKRGQTYKQISKTHEYLLIYTKNNETEFNEIEKSDDNNDLNLVDNIGPFNIRELRNRNPKFGKFNRPNLFYPFYVNEKYVDKDGFSPVSLEKTSEFTFEVYPYNSLGEESCWRWGKNLSQENNKINTLDSNLVAKKKKDGNYNIYEKYRKSTYKVKSIWDNVDFINEKGTIQLGELGLKNYFDFPKPVELIKQVIELASDENSIIMDFFSGSATTAQAVIEMNQKDNGNRKFIMIQIPQDVQLNQIDSLADVGKLRIKKINENYKDENLDTGFRVFKLDSTNIKIWDENPQDIEMTLLDQYNPIKNDRSIEDVVYEIVLKYGLELTVPIELIKLAGRNVYSVGMGFMLICLESSLTLDEIEEIAKEKPSRIVFYDESFKDDVVRTNAQQILNRYKIEDIRVI